MSLRVMVCSQHKHSGYVGKLISAKKGRTFQFNLFLWVICVYYIPHNYVIPQTMPHDIPQTHSSCQPHRVSRGFQEVFSTVDTMLFHQNTRKPGNCRWNVPAVPRHRTVRTFHPVFKYAFNVIQNWETDALQFYSMVLIFARSYGRRRRK